MGWDFQHKPKGVTVRSVLESDFNYENDLVRQHVLDCAVVGFTAYLAVEHINKETGKREVYAAVCLLSYRRSDYFNFGYKVIDESMGPYQYKCPERILRLLTEPANNVARAWREKCWENINRRKSLPSLKTGYLLCLNRPIQFRNGVESDAFLIKDARRHIFESRGKLYQITRQTLEEVGYTITEPAQGSTRF